MEEKIIEFTNLLRKSGIRVSVAESLDAFVSIDELSLGDREVFKDALRCTMVKRSEDIVTFDQLFDLYWSAFHDNMRESFDGANQEMGGDFDLEQLLEAIAEGMENMPQGEMDLSELAKALLTQDLDKLEQLIRDAAEQAGTERIENMRVSPSIGFIRPSLGTSVLPENRKPPRAIGPRIAATRSTRKNGARPFNAEKTAEPRCMPSAALSPGLRAPKAPCRQPCRQLRTWRGRPYACASSNANRIPYSLFPARPSRSAARSCSIAGPTPTSAIRCAASAWQQALATGPASALASMERRWRTTSFRPNS